MENTMRCKGLGCLLRESCKNWKQFIPQLEDEKQEWMIEEFSPSHGCPNHKPLKVDPVIKEFLNKN